jgi:hypothetical protein
MLGVRGNLGETVGERKMTRRNRVIVVVGFDLRINDRQARAREGSYLLPGVERTLLPEPSLRTSAPEPFLPPVPLSGVFAGGFSGVLGGLVGFVGPI